MRYTLNYSLLSGTMAKPYARGESELFLQKLRLAFGLQTVWKGMFILGASSHLSLLYPTCVFLKVFYFMLWWPGSSAVKGMLCSGRVFLCLMLTCSMLHFLGISHCWKAMVFWKQID